MSEAKRALWVHPTVDPRRRSYVPPVRVVWARNLTPSQKKALLSPSPGQSTVFGPPGIPLKPQPLTDLKDDVTDLRFYRVWATGKNGVRIQAGK